MKLFGPLIIAFSVESTNAGNNIENESSLSSKVDGLFKEWNSWKKPLGKMYETVEEEITRMEIWLENAALIEAHNYEHSLGHKTFTLAMNHYGDLTSHEFAQAFNTFRKPAEDSFIGGTPYLEHFSDRQKLNHHIDWRNHGFVTPVKDQGQCGSCWAFSSTGAIEGQMAKNFGNLTALSEQNLVDCTRKQGNMGCNGGLMDDAFQGVMDEDGINDETDYPYEAVDDKPCRFDKTKSVAKVTGYKYVPEGSERALKHLVAHVGPIAVAIDASNPSFQFYQKGVYYEPHCSPKNLDHAVLAVGYGKSGHDAYWLVKNSWTDQWGDKGYIKMARNKKNHCGIASYAMFPIVSNETEDESFINGPL